LVTRLTDVRTLDYLADLRRESARFHACLAHADPGAPVPSCPGWTAADLLWHLTEVQSFWGNIVSGRLQEPDAAEVLKPADIDYQGLLSAFQSASRALEQTLAATPDETRVWTWADDQTAGFVRRRQAHEALIHRLDAELTTDQVTGLDPALATDGIDEALTVMYGGYPAWATFTPVEGTGRIVAVDTGVSWDLGLGRFSGTSPGSGRTYDDPTVQVSAEPSSSEPAFTVSGTAGELDIWLWKRPSPTEPTVTGDHDVAAFFLEVIAGGIQ
jgi:uncharacterized protein (TIGR03083 family)